MSLRHACLPFLLLWLSAASAAELGVVTQVEGAPLVLRGAAWLKLVIGARIEDGDIVKLPERGQVQVELPNGSIANGVGPDCAGKRASFVAGVLFGLNLCVFFITLEHTTIAVALIILRSAWRVVAESAKYPAAVRSPSTQRGAWYTSSWKNTISDGIG